MLDHQLYSQQLCEWYSSFAQALIEPCLHKQLVSQLHRSFETVHLLAQSHKHQCQVQKGGRNLWKPKCVQRQRWEIIIKYLNIVTIFSDDNQIVMIIEIHDYHEN